MKNEIIEEWKSVARYEHLYVVSSIGNIRSLGRYDSLGRYKPPCIRKLQTCTNGYLFVQLSDFFGVKKQLLVHRIVADAFLKKEEGKNEVNHKNGNKKDNRVENLERVNRSENMTHAMRTGLSKPLVCKGEKHGNTTLTEDEVRKIKLMHPQFSYTELAAIYSTSKSVIASIIKGKTWSHVSIDIL